jgi:hypothetical protein
LAWLSHPAARFVRLPKSLDVLAKELAIPAGRIDLEWERLQTPLGQWKWASECLAKALERGDSRDAELRQRALIEFAGRHWPGWYEQLFARTPTRREILVELCACSDAIAVAHAMRLLPGKSQNRATVFALEKLHDSLCYSRQELRVVPLDCDADPGWDQVEADLSLIRAELATVQRARGVVPEVVSEGLLSLEMALASVRKGPTLETLDEIERSLSSLQSFVRITRLKMSQIAEMEYLTP